MRKKLNVGILFGGKSAEHEVSLQSAKNIFDALDRDAYNPVLIGIDKSGALLLNDPARFLLNADDPRRISLNGESDRAALLPKSGGQLINLNNPAAGRTIDVVFPILHGPFGEDGTVQGILKLADIPFVGAGVLGSAVGMDKDVMKRLLRDGGLPLGAFIAVRAHEARPAFDTAVRRLGLPFFVKPANMGSSVGVSKVHHEGEYGPALDAAFTYDRKIILEEFIQGRELECAVLGNEEPAASIPGEITASHEFYSYEAKYIDEDGAALDIPARIPGETARKIQELAVKTFQVLDCAGLGRILVNEINTMPGFTKISMYPKLWEASGLSYTALIDRLIHLALDRYGKERTLQTSYATG